MNCKFRKPIEKLGQPNHFYCDLATQKSGQVCPVTDDMCQACMSKDSCGTPASPIVKLLISDAEKEKQRVADAQKSDELIGYGVGTELKRMIPDFLESPNCSCKDFAKKMNIWGIDGCEERRERIVDRLVRESKKRPIFKWTPGKMTRYVADKMLTTAINRAVQNEKNSTDWFVAVTTAPRSTPTIHICLDSLILAGFKPHIFAEPGSEPVGPAHAKNLIMNDERLGVWHNWISGARYAIENSDAEIIMTVQDDSLFHPDTKMLTESLLWPAPRTGFVSLYTPKKYSIRPNYKTSKRAKGINKVTTKSLWGACALVWPRKVLEEVLQHKIIETWAGAPIRTRSAWPKKREQRRANPWMIQNSDTAIGDILNSMKRSMWFVDPSPVNHFAQTSAAGHGGNGGNRNCMRCADFKEPLIDQLYTDGKMLRNGKPMDSVCDYSELIL